MQLNNQVEFEKIMLGAPMGMCILDASNLLVLRLNSKFVEIAGKSYEIILNCFYWDVFPEVRAQYEDAMNEVVRSGVAYHADEVKLMLIRNGFEEDIVVTFVYSPIKDDLGKVVNIAIYVLENTIQVAERQKETEAKQAYLQEIERLKSYLIQAPAGIGILRGPELVYELVNPAYQRLLPGRNLQGRPLFEALPELIGTEVEKILLDVYRTGNTFEVEELLVPLALYEGGPLEDRYFTFSYQAWLDEKGVIDGILAIVFDVTNMIKVMNDLRQARETADQQKRIYETITSGTPDLMYVFDLDYRFTYANNALLTMWGKPWEDAIGKGLRENGYEEWHALMHEREIDQIVATRKPVRGEVSFPHATLGKRVYDYILVPVLDENGIVEAIAGTTRDVTERKLLEEELERTSEVIQSVNEEMAATNEELSASNEELSASNEELLATNEELVILNQQYLDTKQKVEEGEIALRLAIEAADFGTWFIHSLTREFITDARLKELFGYYPDEELSIEQALAQITDEYRDYVSQQLENAIYRGGDYDVTYPVIGLHDAKLRWLRAIGNLKADPSGAFSAFTGVVMDITDSYLSARKIADAEEDLRMAIESGELSTWRLEQTTGVITATDRFFKLFGFNHDDEISYQAVLERVETDYQPLIRESFATSFNDNTAFKVEFPLNNQFGDGKVRWVRSVGKVLRDGKNGTHISGIMADITEQKMDDIRKNDFIGMVSHELKTPLTSLSAYIQLVTSMVKGGENRIISNALDKANIQIKRMGNMINGFLNVSRLESAKLEIDKSNFDIAKLIDDVIQDISLTTSSHQIQFKTHNALIINADKEKIGSVINNLISNAIKYSPLGKEIIISFDVLGEKVRVGVSDQGIGLSQHDKAKVFDRFFRAENKQAKFIAGFGIGLYLSAEIVRRHEGEIWVDSEIDQGSTFYFSLPTV